MKIHVVALSGILLATPALAQPSAPAEGASSSSPFANSSSSSSNDQAREEPRQICRRVESGTSRRIGSRLICHTAEEWRAIQNSN